MHVKRLLLPLFIALILGALFALVQLVPVQALLGDVDNSGAVSQTDLAILDAAYKSDSPPGPPNWDWRADLNLDQLVDLKDLALMGRSHGDSINLHWQRRLSNGRQADPHLSNPFWVDAAVDPQGRVHVIWLESTTSANPLYYTRLDMAGNSLTEDVLISTDGDSARLAVDSRGIAHIVYLRRFSGTGLYYAAVDPASQVSMQNSLVCSGCDNPALAVDEYDHTHLLFQDGNQAQYAILGRGGETLLPAARMNPGIERTPTAFAVAVSADGARHLLWRQATGVGGGDLRYTRITREGVVTTNNVLLAHLEGTYNDRRYYLGVDSHNAAHAIYYDNRGVPGSIYWRRANPDGTFSPEVLVTSSAQASAGLDVAFSVDSTDRIHLSAPFRTSGDLGYARLDRDGNLLVPFQRAAFHTEGRAALVVSPTGAVMLVALSNTTDATGAEPLFMVSTLADPAANDTTRADLVVDDAHLNLLKAALRINEDADLTVTVTNGGWAPAVGNTLSFTYAITGGKQEQAVLTLPDLAPFTSTTVHKTIAVPDFEEQIAWPVTLQVSSTTAETTLTNNQVVARFGVIPPPHFFNLEVAPYDETYAPDDRLLAVPFPGAVIDLHCDKPLYNATISPADEYNIFWEIQLDMDPANGPLFPTQCVVSAHAPGYSSASTPVTARRFSEADPYRLVVTPALPLDLYLNTWGSVAGLVTGGGGPLEEARVTLETGLSVDTGANGQFSLQKVPAGQHSLRIWRKGYTPIPALNVEVFQGQQAVVNRDMLATQRAEVFGTITNAAGRPLSGVSVTLRGNPGYSASMLTSSDGSYTLAVANFPTYTGYTLEAVLSDYVTYTANLPDLAPGWPLQHDIAMERTTSGAVMEKHGSPTSWGQEEAWCKSYGDDVAWNVEVMESIGSEWCPEYHVNVDWGQYAYSLALDYTSDGESNTLTTLSITFDNEPFMSYEVGSGKWSGGGESRAVTGQRIDWIELVALDAAGNALQVPLWKNDAVWYSTAQTDPQHARRELQIDTPAGDWAVAGIRIFYTIGQYAEGEDHHWKDWNPPADLGLAGSGAPSGANRQVLTWWLGADTLTLRYSLADYRSALNPNGTAMVSVPAASASTQLFQAVLPAEVPGGPAAIEATTAGLSAASPNPIRVGTPFAVDLTLTEFEARPVYALEFDLDFNQTYLRLVSIQASSDFGGPGGSHWIPLDLAAVNGAGLITDEAVVRLGAPTGLSQGRVIRLVFLPVKKTAATTLDLKNVTLADLDSDLFTPVHLTDLSIPIGDARIFLPMIRR